MVVELDSRLDDKLRDRDDGRRNSTRAGAPQFPEDIFCLERRTAFTCGLGLEDEREKVRVVIVNQNIGNIHVLDLLVLSVHAIYTGIASYLPT